MEKAGQCTGEKPCFAHTGKTKQSPLTCFLHTCSPFLEQHKGSTSTSCPHRHGNLNSCPHARGANESSTQPIFPSVYLLYFMYVSVCQHVCLCAACTAGAPGQKSSRIHWNWSYRGYVLPRECKPRSSPRATSVSPFPSLLVVGFA